MARWARSPSGSVRAGSKDLVLGIIGRITTAGGNGYAIEYRGPVIETLGMEERMTLCNMTIEAGARSGMVAADQKTVDYLRGRRYVPAGAELDRLAQHWLQFKTDPGAKFDHSMTFDGAEFAPQVTWGTNPGMVTEVTSKVPDPSIGDIKLDRVFIGSCTNSRITDLKAAAEIVKGRKVASTVQAMVVPGSQLVKEEAEQLGLDKIFTQAGFEWRE